MELFYNLNDSALGTFGLIWRLDTEEIKIIKIYLPSNKNLLLEKIKNEYPNAIKSNSLEELFFQIKNFISGENIKFNIELLDFGICTAFEKKVLIADFNIPRGYVSTYSRIAKSSGVPKGARAVGNVLAANPFPLVIPCHRVLRADGSLGGFGGGFEMKKRLLENEGIILSKGKVRMDKIYY